MGWFDNEEQDGNSMAPAPQQSAAPRAVTPSPAPSGNAGSTLGRQIHIDGKIVCEEDLTILGRVDGTIHAKGTLVIAKEADVRAKIDGQRVMVHGKVNGDVEGAERVVLGQTARLTGNIETPTLEIIEGAHFRGNVDMKQAKAAPAKQAAPQAPVVAKKEPAAKEPAAPASADAPKGPAASGAKEAAGVQKPASS